MVSKEKQLEIMILSMGKQIENIKLIVETRFRQHKAEIEVLKEKIAELEFSIPEKDFSGYDQELDEEKI